ncbi:MAG TPA: glutaredoxin domain-containing protein [Candidatus Nanoarchaeia archaeon]|nr:glutaredoxin domain-containing protein [Candidatus Nanoarchaeia archaeon]
MDIKIYTNPNCSWCQKAKAWFKKKKQSFQELDLDESDTYRDEILEKTRQLATPVIDIDGEIIVGFDEPALTLAIEKAKNKI